MTEKRKWRILIIEDQQDNADDAFREIRDAFDQDPLNDVEVRISTDFGEGYRLAAAGDADIVVLDVKRDVAGGSPDDLGAGRSVFLDIKSARFTPVIFWTAIPNHVQDQVMPPLVAVIPKDETEKIPVAIRAAIESRAVEVIAEIERHVSDVLRDHMWTELGPFWQDYTDGSTTDTVAHVLISRLARVLEGRRGAVLTSDPQHRYIHPPVRGCLGTGDILLRTMADGADWWIVLTPACDLEPRGSNMERKASRVLLGRASRLEDHPKHQAWKRAVEAGGEAKGKWNNLQRDVLAATAGRFYFVPAFRLVPDLVVDLEDVQAFELQDVDSFERIASLVSPYAEALLVQHSQYYGRIGVPDLDVEKLQRRLTGPSQDKEGEARAAADAT